MSQTSQFVVALARHRGRTWVNGRVRNRPVAKLMLPRYQADPYPVYEQVRAAGQLIGNGPAELVTVDYQLSQAILTDRRFGVRPAGTGSAPSEGDPMDLSFLERDPPEHARLRRLASGAFTPRRVASYRALVEKTAAELLAGGRAETPIDLVAEFADPLPVKVITTLLGIDVVDQIRLIRHGAALAAALDGIGSVRHARALMSASQELDLLFAGLIERRRTDPADDLVSVLVAEHGAELSERDLRSMCLLLLIAGFETTVNLISNAVLAFARQPDQWELLRNEPDRAPSAVEEALRYDAPVQQTGRIAQADVVLEGHRIPQGSWVRLLLGGANRDPALCDRPADFDITRSARPDHLGFAAGIHYCLGAPLARLEGAIALQVLGEALPTLRLAGPVRYRRSTTIRGPAALLLAR